MKLVIIAESQLKGQFPVQLYSQGNFYHVQYGGNAQSFTLFEHAMDEFRDCVRHAYACYECGGEWSCNNTDER